MLYTTRMYLMNELGVKMPVEIIRERFSPGEPYEFTIRQIPFKYGRCNGKSISQLICDDLIPAINLSSTIKKVIFNDPATIVLWLDGTKTVVKCQEGDEYSKEKGLALCIAKKHLGNKSNFNNEFKRWINE